MATKHKKLILFILLVLVILLCIGCGEVFKKDPTELKSDAIREQVSRIKIPEPNLIIPDILKEQPRIERYVGSEGEEWKLHYYCRHHTADEMKQIIDDQFGKHVVEKNVQKTLPDYKVTPLGKTNQLTVGCKTEEQAKSVLKLLQNVDVPPIQVKIVCMISMIYADKTVDQETFLEIMNLFGENLTAGTAARPFGGDVMDLIIDGPLLPAFPGGSMREVARSRMGMTLGYKSGDFLSMIDVLESKGYLTVMMNPTLEVVNGQTAKIMSSEKVPLERSYLFNRFDDRVESKVEYEDVIDSLEVTPHVFADGMIGLETIAVIGSKNTPEGIKQIPVVTKKQIENAENRIPQGGALIIGGIRKAEEFSVNRGVPVFKDIPVAGALFRGIDYEKRAVEILFILIPTISDGGMPVKDMAEILKERHKSPENNGIVENEDE
jgi:type II secretory pathway component GspD/PulD (secretin)